MEDEMIRRNSNVIKGLMAWLTVVALFAMPLSILGQTRIEMPKNKYNISDDVQLGREAAQQVHQQMPILRDGTVDSYVESVGQRLVAAIPAEFQHREFTYGFDVVDARDINAFALPGGPMFVNRGMIEAARNEGEMAGVMAHEISHVTPPRDSAGYRDAEVSNRIGPGADCRRGHWRCAGRDYRRWQSNWLWRGCSEI